MKKYGKKFFRVSLITFLGIAVGLSVSQAQEPSVSGVYLLIEFNGEKLPAFYKRKPNDERCKEEILGGALLLDSEGRSAAFLTERDVCLHEDGSETAAWEGSLIFPGTYNISGNQITIEDDFGPSQAILKGDLLVYKIGGEGSPITEFVLQRE